MNELLTLNDQIRVLGTKKLEIKKEISGIKTQILSINESINELKLSVEQDIYTGEKSSEYKNEKTRELALKTALKESLVYQDLLGQKEMMDKELFLAEQRLNTVRVDYKYNENLLQIKMLEKQAS